jgi:hypothetical protein
LKMKKIERKIKRKKDKMPYGPASTHFGPAVQPTCAGPGCQGVNLLFLVRHQFCWAPFFRRDSRSSLQDPDSTGEFARLVVTTWMRGVPADLFP